MFIAMNRFRVVKGSEEAFENVWLSRDSYLHTVPGFVASRRIGHGKQPVNSVGSA